MFKSCLLGCGPRARGHARAYEHVEKARLEAVCDKDPQRLRAFLEEFEVERAYSDLREMLEREKPDLLHVVTQPTQRVEFFELAAETGVPAMLIEKPLALDGSGDFVEFDVEIVVIPKSDQDYYGPNENLRADLAKNGNTWKPIHRQALGNDLDIQITRGRLVRRYPPAIEVDSSEHAEFEITGGVGYVPITFTGLRSSAGYILARQVGKKLTPVDQSVHGNDYWQTDYDPAAKVWRITYNVSLDNPKNDTKGKAKFVFGRKKKR